MYSISKGKKASLKDDVNAAIKSFCEKHGYKPQFIIINLYQSEEVRGLEVYVQTDRVQPGHFMLGPVKEKYEAQII
jgi:hypothetical protein